MVKKVVFRCVHQPRAPQARVPDTSPKTAPDAMAVDCVRIPEPHTLAADTLVIWKAELADMPHLPEPESSSPSPGHHSGGTTRRTSVVDARGDCYRPPRTAARSCCNCRTERYCRVGNGAT